MNDRTGSQSSFDVSSLRNRLCYIWRASRFLSIITSVFSLIFLFLAGVILYAGQPISALEYSIIGIPVAAFTYFYSVSGNHAIRFLTLGLIIGILALIDALVSSEVTLRMRQEPTTWNYLRL